MALKDITLGQYFPGNSFVHRLDPRSKILAVVMYIIALFLCKSFVGYGDCSRRYLVSLYRYGKRSMG